MPIYEYECPKCGNFERVQGINDDPLVRCPTCRSRVTKLISSTSFRLKGDGWYADGYSGKKPSKPVPASSAKSNGTESKAKSAGSGESAKAGDSSG